MGYAKYTEDLIDQRWINWEKIKPYIFQTKQLPLLRSCIYCEERFDSDEKLFDHMRKEHNDSPIKVYLNNEVLIPGEFIEMNINSFGFYPKNKNTTFIFNDRVYDIKTKNGYQDLTSYITQDMDIIEFEIDNEIRKIYRRKIRSISPKVSEIIHSMNKAAYINQRPNILEVNKFKKDFRLELPEREYIDAYFNYFFACINKSSDCDQFYYSAYNRLLPFIENDARSRLLVKLISLRYLWIDGLSELCKDNTESEFSLVCAFLSGKEISNKTIKEEQSDKIFEIYVEESEYQNTKAIISFMKKEYNAVNHYLGSIESSMQNRDLNKVLRDKILLLKAGMAKVNEDEQGYRYYLKQVKNRFIIKSGCEVK